MTLVAGPLRYRIGDLLKPEERTAYVRLRADDARRAQEAASVITSVMHSRQARQPQHIAVS